MDIKTLPADVVAILKDRGKSPEQISSMTPEAVFNEYCNWNGLHRWGNTLIGMIDTLRAASGSQGFACLATAGGTVMNMQFVALLDTDGAPIEHPASQPASLSWNAASGEAYAWGEDGVTCLGKLIRARIARIEAAGIRVEGVEEIGGGPRIRAQEWHFRPA